MSARARFTRLAPLTLVTGALAAALAGLGVSFGACHPLEGESGVHVTVSLADGGWADTDPFDHITVIARSGSQVEVVCFTPTVAFNLPADAGITTADPCADDAQTAWTSVPTVATWQFGTRTRTANFPFAADVGVTVTAEAHLGGQAAIGAASTPTSSVIGGSSVALSLLRSGANPACGTVELGQTLPGDGGTTFVCGDKAGTCLCPANPSFRVDTTCVGSVSAVTCGGGTAMLDPTLTRAGCADDDVTRGVVPQAFGMDTCAHVSSTVRLFRCLEGRDAGTCTPSADCTTPSISLLLRRVADGVVLSEAPLSCVPPTVFPIPVRTTVQTSDTLLRTWVALAAAQDAGDHSCELELGPIVLTNDCSPGR